MEVRACADALLRWAVSRVGSPSGITALPQRLVRPPTAHIPDVFPNNNVRELIPRLRYPIEDQVSLHLLWKAYEISLADAHGGSKEGMGSLYARVLRISPKIAEYLFGSKQDDDVKKQAAEAALKVAEIAHGLYGAKWMTGVSGHAVKSGPDPVFGILNNLVVSKFTPNFHAPFAEFMDVLRTRRQGAVIVAGPRLLNAYRAAEDAGDEAVIYILDSAAWAAHVGVPDLSLDSIEMVLAAASTGEAGRVRARQRSNRYVLTEGVYRQCAYVIEHGDEPKLVLKELLVPVHLSAAEFMAKFTNPYLKSVTRAATREKLAKALEELYKQDNLDNPGVEEDD